MIQQVSSRQKDITVYNFTLQNIHYAPNPGLKIPHTATELWQQQKRASHAKDEWTYVAAIAAVPRPCAAPEVLRPRAIGSVNLPAFSRIWAKLAPSKPAEDVYFQ